MGNRVTLQEIADALGMSRNTVSRALNNSGSVSADTRNKICQMATAMGYKQFTTIESAAVQTGNASFANKDKMEIALFTHSFPGASHSGTKLLEAFQNKASTMARPADKGLMNERE